MDVLCPQTFYGKIKLLEFSVKGLRMPGVINIRNRSVCNPYVIRIDSSTPVMAQKISTDIPRGFLEAVRMPPEVIGNSRKPQGPIGMVHEEAHGYVISLQIYTDSHGDVYRQ